MLLQGGLAIERMCFLTGISRAGFYRYLRAQDPWQEEMAVRSEVQRIALEHHGRYGYRRITAELRRQGMPVNHKRVARLMREDNLVGTELQHRRGELTEPGDHGEIYVNLANRLKLTGPNQVWVADITFVRLKRVFVYLAVVLDKFSRKVVGWNLARTLTARLPLGALEMALEGRAPGAGLVHHSDRGAQYAHSEYLRTLRNHGVIPSVSRPGSPCVQTELNRREKNLIEYTEKIGEIEKEIKKMEAHFAQTELLRFVLSERYVFAPLNFANAAAGLPHLGWRRSFLLCSRIECSAETSINYLIFEAVKIILEGASPTRAEEAASELRRQISNRNRFESVREYLGENWPALEHAVLAAWNSSMHADARPYEIVSMLLSALKAPRRVLNPLLDAMEKDSLPT